MKSICQLMAKRCALSTGNLPRGGLPRNSVDRITDRPDMTLAVYHGRKASTQTNKNKTNVKVSTDVPMRVKIHRYQYNNLFIIAININSHFQLFVI